MAGPQEQVNVKIQHATFVASCGTTRYPFSITTGSQISPENRIGQMYHDLLAKKPLPSFSVTWYRRKSMPTVNAAHRQ